MRPHELLLSPSKKAPEGTGPTLRGKDGREGVSGGTQGAARAVSTAGMRKLWQCTCT